MECPKCNAATKVLETRMGARRRECDNGHRFWTEEILVRMIESRASRLASKVWKGYKKEKK